MKSGYQLRRKFWNKLFYNEKIHKQFHPYFPILQSYNVFYNLKLTKLIFDREANIFMQKRSFTKAKVRHFLDKKFINPTV